MKAAVLHRMGPIEMNPLTVEDVRVPSPGNGQVLIKVSACGVCRSNLHMIEGDWVTHGVPAKTPIIPGHEIVGKIMALGPGATGFQEGDRVGVQPLWSSDMTCEYCRAGNENLCQAKQITGETVDGGYAEYMIANLDHIYSVPDSVKDVEAAPLFCPGVTGYRAVRKAELGPGKKVAVFGIGGVGHMVLQFAKREGARVVAVTRSSQHLELAQSLGAERIVDPSKGDLASVQKEIGMVDASVVFAPSTVLARLAIRVTKPGGVIVVGVWVDLGEFAFGDEKRIVGSVIGSRKDMREVLYLARSGEVRVVSEAFKLERANEVLTRLKKGEIRARAVLTP